MSSTSYLKDVKINRLPHIDPRVHGHIADVPVGSRWKLRTECSQDGVHAPLRAGIHGTAQSGAYSIVMSGGYEDDLDRGEHFEYTGSGGRDLKADKLDSMQGKTSWEAPQSADQDWTRGNKALKVSEATGKPVRVVRGANLNSKYRPTEGYRYDGLYTVVKAWKETGKSGFEMCKFRFERLPGQPPIPLYDEPVAPQKRKQKAEDTTKELKKSKSGHRMVTMSGITFKNEGSSSSGVV